jgi:steroid delta-isomerase-like uncharacterized protein
MTSSFDNKALIGRWFAELDRGHLGNVETLAPPDLVAHFPAVPGPLDREGVRQLMGQLYAGFPDLRHGLEAQFEEGDRVASRIVVRGTHLGSHHGVPASGRPVIFLLMNIAHIVDGQILELWSEFDALGLLQQIGAFPHQ